MSCHSSKRQREHEGLTTCHDDSIREKKKHRSLPLRSPRRPSQRSKLVGTALKNSYSAYSPSALTPVGSSDDEDGFAKLSLPGSNFNKSQQSLQGCHTSGLDCDTSMDIDVSEDSISVDRDTTSLLPVTGSDRDARHPSLNPRNITCQSFSTGHLATLNSLNPQRPTLPTISVSDSTVSPSLSVELTGDPLWWRCPRLPSPVSDNGDGVSVTKDMSDDSEMVYDMLPLQSLPSLSSVNSSSMEAEAADMRQRLSSLDLPSQANAKPTSALRPPKKQGFSMGYRADCDKCRRRVPGHYSHIIGC
ncbi:hypothetical protein BJX76DRAFT_201984 [Aspergillus varians]